MQGYEQDNSAAKKTFFSIVAVLTLVMAVAGGTFAFFAASASNAGTVNGTAASVSLDLDVSQVGGMITNDLTPTGTVTKRDPMVPLLNSALSTALVGTDLTPGNGKNDPLSCVDANKNISCKVYQFVITNTSTSSVSLTADLTFTSPGFENLYFRQLVNATGVGGFYSEILIESGNDNRLVLSRDNYAENPDELVLGADESATYYFVVWIRETGSAQNETDVGSFSGTLTVLPSTGDGVTSTFE